MGFCKIGEVPTPMQSVEDESGGAGVRVISSTLAAGEMEEGPAGHSKPRPLLRPNCVAKPLRLPAP